MNSYTAFKILPNGNLKISLNKMNREEKKEAKKLDWWTLNEYNFCNGYQDIDDHNRCYIGALTSSPIIADGCIDEESTKEELEQTKVWWFPEYQTTDEKEQLFKKGYVIFTLAD